MARAPRILLIEQTSKKTKERFRSTALKVGIEIDFAIWKHITVDSSRGHNQVILIKDKKITDYDLIYIRVVENLYTEACQLARAANQLGVRVVDLNLASDAQIADTKIEQILRCSLNRIPIPKTVYSSDYDKLLTLSEGFTKWPLVLKAVDLHRGEGVFLVNSRKDIKKYFEKVGENGKRSFILQEKIDYVKDYRLIVIGGKVLGAIQRIAKKGEFRSNISLGGKAKTVQNINPKLAKIALNTAKIMNLDIAGVDVLEDKQGNYYFIEINRAPQTKGFEKATGIDTLTEIFKYFKTII